VQIGPLTYLLLMLVPLVATPAASTAAELQLVSDTILRGFERDLGRGGKVSPVPAYQYLQVDYGSLTTPGISFHGNGWGRMNLGDDAGDGKGELLSAFLQYLPPGRDYQLRAGRQYIFEGVARDSLDGVYAKGFLLPTLSMAAYLGSPTVLDSEGEDRGSDFIYGGKITQSRSGLYDLGISYRHLTNNSERDEESLGSDLALLLPGKVSLLGHSAYNLVTDGWGEHSYELRLPLGDFTLSPFYQRYRYQDFFNSRSNSANPFRFLQGTGNTLTVFGTEAFWYPVEQAEFALRVKNYDYDKRFGSSQFYTLAAAWRWRIFSEIGGELGRMQGHEAVNKYLLGRGYCYWNLSRGFLSGDVMHVRYDRAIYAQKSSWFVSLGGGTRFMDDALTLRLSFDYSSDPYFNRDVRALLRVSYLLDKNPGRSSPGSLL